MPVWAVPEQAALLMLEILTWKQRGTFLGMVSSKGGSKEGAGELCMHVARLGCWGSAVVCQPRQPLLVGVFSLAAAF